MAALVAPAFHNSAVFLGEQSEICALVSDILDETTFMMTHVPAQVHPLSTIRMYPVPMETFPSLILMFAAELLVTMIYNSTIGRRYCKRRLGVEMRRHSSLIFVHKYISMVTAVL